MKSTAFKVSFLPEIHRTLPHSHEAEQGMLCSILLSPSDVMGDYAEVLESVHFHHPANAQIYSVMLDLWSKKIPIEFISLTQTLRDRNLLDQVGGAEYITQLQTFLPTAANVDFYVDSLLEKYDLRQIITICTEYAGRAYDEQGDAKGLLEGVQAKVAVIGKRDHASQEETHQEFMVSYLDTLDNRMKTSSKKPGIPPPFPKMEKESGLLRFGKITVIVGEPGAGKSILGNQILCHAALELNEPCALFSLEMPKEECVDRALAYQSKIHLTNLTEGRMAKGEMTRCTAGISSLAGGPLRIYDRFTTPEGIESKMRSLKRIFGLKLAMIDYLQILNITGTKKDSRRDMDVGSVTTRFKRLAIELGIHVIIISAATSKDNGDVIIRESKQAQHDADTIWKVLLNHDTQIADRVFVDKWRGQKAKYPIYITPHFEYCRMVEKVNGTNGNNGEAF